MAVLHALHGLGIQEFSEAAVPGTFLLDRPQPWTLSDDLLYGLTHEVFYASDFGARPAGLPPESLPYLRFTVSVWLDVVAMQKNWDLLAELIMTAHCVGLTVPPCTTSLLRLNIREDGSIDGPRGGGRGIPARNAEDRRRANAYHTTLVSLLALSNTCRTRHQSGRVSRDGLGPARNVTCPRAARTLVRAWRPSH